MPMLSNGKYLPGKILPHGPEPPCIAIHGRIRFSLHAIQAQQDIRFSHHKGIRSGQQFPHCCQYRFFTAPFISEFNIHKIRQMGIRQQNTFHGTHLIRQECVPDKLSPAIPHRQVFPIFFFLQFPLLQRKLQPLRHIGGKSFRMGNAHPMQA